MIKFQSHSKKSKMVWRMLIQKQFTCDRLHEACLKVTFHGICSFGKDKLRKLMKRLIPYLCCFFVLYFKMVNIISFIYHTQSVLLHTTSVRRVKFIKSAPKKDIKTISKTLYLYVTLSSASFQISPEKLTEKD